MRYACLFAGATAATAGAAREKKSRKSKHKNDGENEEEEEVEAELGICYFLACVRTQSECFTSYSGEAHAFSFATRCLCVHTHVSAA